MNSKRKLISCWLVLLALIVAGCAPVVSAENLAVKGASPAPASGSQLDANDLGNGLMTEWDGAAQQHRLRVVSMQDGEDQKGFTPFALGKNYIFRPIPGERKLVFLSLKSDCGAVCIQVLDVDLWTLEQITLVEESNSAELFYIMDVSPDGRYLLGAYTLAYSHETLFVADLQQNRLVTAREVEILPMLLSFTADGDVLAYGSGSSPSTPYNPIPKITWLNGEDLSLQHELALEDVRDGNYVENPDEVNDPIHEGIYWSPARVISPDRQNLYIVHAYRDRLTTVDLTRQTARTVDIRKPQTLFDRLMSLGVGVVQAKMLNGATREAVISADGERIYVVGQNVDSTREEGSNEWDMQFTPYGLLVLEAHSGEEFERVEGVEGSGQISFSADGRRLYVQGWDVNGDGQAFTEVVDGDTLQVQQRIPGLVLPVRDMQGREVMISGEWSTSGYNFSWLEPDLSETILTWPEKVDGWWLSAP
jgi:hypothetical protein